MSKLERCPNCNASVQAQVLRRTPREVYCSVCMCIWLLGENRVLLTCSQIDKIQDAADEQGR